MKNRSNSVLPANPLAGQDLSALPASYVNGLDSLRASAAKDINSGTWFARHPVLSNVLTGVAGVGLGALSGANTYGSNAYQGALQGAMLPFIVSGAEHNRQSNVAAAYQKAVQDLTERQAKLLPTQQSGYETQAQVNALANSGIKSPVPQGGFLSHEANQMFLNGGTTGQSLNNITNRYQQALTDSVDSLGQRSTNQGQPTAPSLPPMFPYSEDNPIQIGATAQGQPVQALQPYIYTDPTIASAAATQLGNIYEKAPGNYATLQKLNPEIDKLNSEVKKALAEGDAAKALSILRKAQTDTERQMPAKVRAETFATTERGKLERRTDPNIGRGGSNDPLVALGRTQEILQRQKQAILSQMQQNGFIDKTTGLITPPAAQDAWGGVFGLGAHGSNEAKVNQYNALQKQLNSIDNQLTGGSAPQKVYPNPQNPDINTGSNSNGMLKGRHGTYRTK